MKLLTVLVDKGFSESECKLVESFEEYLVRAEQSKLLYFSSECGFGVMPYSTRWSVGYRKNMMGKMYGVGEYLRRCSKGGVVTLLTLTGYQGGKLSREVMGGVVSREELFERLKRGWKLLSDLIRKECPGLEYVWVYESHRSGYPHMHVALFGYVPGDMQERLKSLWSDKYGVGSWDHGLDFRVKNVNESIRSIRDYLMKYVMKGIGGDGRSNWSAEEWVYHSLAWKHRHRYVGMSRSISRYCTARRLRYRFGKDLAEKCGCYVSLPELPVDKSGLVFAMNQFRGPPPVDDSERWSCVFVCGRFGDVSLIRRTGVIGLKKVEWVNDTVGELVGYADTFLRGSGNGFSWVLGQQTLL